HEPAGDGAAGYLTDTDARRRPRRGADRVAAPLLAAADGQRLPGRERERARQVRGDAERDRGRVLGQRLDALDGEPVEVGAPGPVAGNRVARALGARALVDGALVDRALVDGALAHRALTPSKGSPQALQRCSDLQAVALNRAVSRVSGEPQRGQRADGGAPRVSGTGPARRGAGDGGAMPAAVSLRWPSAVIQSVLQGGASWVATVTRSKPTRCRRASTSAVISRIAGQPLYVGVIVTTIPPGVTST